MAERAFLPVTAAAERLGISRRTAYEYVRAGVIPAVRINGTSRVPTAALERWIAEREAEALAAVTPGDEVVA